MAAGMRRAAGEPSFGMVVTDDCRATLPRRTLRRLVSTGVARHLAGGDAPLRESSLSSLTAMPLLVYSLGVSAEAVPGRTLQDAEHNLCNSCCGLSEITF